MLDNYLAIFFIMKKVIGITGGIGSGKSTVSDFFEKNNCKVLRADDIAKELMASDKKVVKKISDEFGEECYLENKLNAKVLADKVFSNPERLSELNKIVHPPTISKILFDIQRLKRKHDIIFVETAILFEAKMNEYFDHILLVTADEDIRLKRLLERNNTNAHEIKSRMMNQIEEKEKRNKSDFVLENNGLRDELLEKAHFFLNLFSNLP